MKFPFDAGLAHITLITFRAGEPGPVDVAGHIFLSKINRARKLIQAGLLGLENRATTAITSPVIITHIAVGVAQNERSIGIEAESYPTPRREGPQLVRPPIIFKTKLGRNLSGGRPRHPGQQREREEANKRRPHQRRSA